MSNPASPRATGRLFALALALGGALLIGGAGHAQAQSRGLSATAPDVSDRAAGDLNLQTLFTFGPVRGVIDAPVQAPGDSSIAYRTYQGQSMTGADHIVSQFSGSGPID